MWKMALALYTVSHLTSSYICPIKTNDEECNGITYYMGGS